MRMGTNLFGYCEISLLLFNFYFFNFIGTKIGIYSIGARKVK